jgi:hypothetical protein
MTVVHLPLATTPLHLPLIATTIAVVMMTAILVNQNPMMIATPVPVMIPAGESDLLDLPDLRD